ncbi:helix-turn-helix transcriptional regulator [Actinomadura hibisca]|uniref:helix-turn-helix transcriptional regulator n=1 Tax=Actinomadura hibisca TaxID=68565 RepID=UPI0008349FCE|nr:helix-turn-helix transcriptional regulator [Actinomadura hibisca]
MSDPRAPASRGRRRPELAAFLRSRRARITPEDVGLPPAPRRRTPGLRREEVAQLAGVGITWYTWLEQGRPINASPQVLEAVARTLRLDAAERAHLFRLAGVPLDEPSDPVSCLLSEAPDLREVLAGLDPLPAAVSNARSDVLAWNRAYAALFPHLVNAPAAERNTMWMAFTVPPCCNPIVDLDNEGAVFVASFRQRYSRHMDEPGWDDFVRRLRAASPEFARLWATQDVAEPGSRDKVFRHAAVGEVATRATAFDVASARGVRMVVYRPLGEDDRKRVEWLLDNPGAAAADHTH